MRGYFNLIFLPKIISSGLSSNEMMLFETYWVLRTLASQISCFELPRFYQNAFSQRAKLRTLVFKVDIFIIYFSLSFYRYWLYLSILPYCYTHLKTKRRSRKKKKRGRSLEREREKVEERRKGISAERCNGDPNSRFWLSCTGRFDDFIIIPLFARAVFMLINLARTDSPPSVFSCSIVFSDSCLFVQPFLVFLSSCAGVALWLICH